jgi:glyoxalase-like protein
MQFCDVRGKPQIRSAAIQRAEPEIDRQLPLGNEIFLDHVGHFVRDPDAASRALTRAGFAPAPLSIQVNPDPAGGAPQPTGTGNVTAMFTRGYIEVLFKTADTPLGRQLDAGLARYGGVHLAAFSVADAAMAHARLAASGFRMQPLVQMQRPVDTGGAPGTAAFTLARVEPPEMPEGRIQILTHRTEHTVWQPRWLSHPNGALALTSVTIVVADVEEAAQRFARFTGRNAVPSSLGQTVTLDRGRVELVAADVFAQMLPEIPIPSLPFSGAYGIKVKSLTALDDVLARADLTTRRRDHDLVTIFPEEIGRGAWLFAE